MNGIAPICSEDAGLLALLAGLSGADYRFVTPTPATHARVIARRKSAESLRDIFGWSLPFARDALPAPLLDALVASGMLAEDGPRLRSRVRVSSLCDNLFLHSAFPTDEDASVFFGPDSYRFARFVLAELGARPAAGIVDVGAGAGAGAIAALSEGCAKRALLGDINPHALRFARVNARHAGVAIETVDGTGLDAIGPDLPVAIMNPPFIADDAKRTYRDGGGELGTGLALEWAIEAARRIPAGGCVLLYTGSPIVGGEDRLEAELRRQLPEECLLRYEEIDPDIFGEELEREAYAKVERIAAVGAVISLHP